MERSKTVVLTNGKMIDAGSHTRVEKVIWKVDYDQHIAGLSYHKLLIYHYTNIRREILCIKKGGRIFRNSIESIWIKTEGFYRSEFYDRNTCKFKQRFIRDFIILMLKQNSLHVLQRDGVRSTLLKQLYLLQHIREIFKIICNENV